MNWIEIKKQLPPKNARVLVYGPEMGISVAMYHYSPAWEPFDEEAHHGLHKQLTDSLRRLNECMKDEPEKHRWACACEDSYWDIDYFTHWAELPEEPI